MDELTERGSWEAEPSAPGPALLGDIVVCPQFAQVSRRRSAGTRPSHEIRILVAHGLLHLLGLRPPRARRRDGDVRPPGEARRRLGGARREPAATCCWSCCWSCSSCSRQGLAVLESALGPDQHPGQPRAGRGATAAARTGSPILVEERARPLNLLTLLRTVAEIGAVASGVLVVTHSGGRGVRQLWHRGRRHDADLVHRGRGRRPDPRGAARPPDRPGQRPVRRCADRALRPAAAVADRRSATRSRPGAACARARSPRRPSCARWWRSRSSAASSTRGSGSSSTRSSTSATPSCAR